MKRLGLVLVLLLFGAGVGWVGLGDRDFWPPDEARYGEVARELSDGPGHPFVPHLNGEVYPDKPPGYFLAVDGFAKLRGTQVDETSARLPSLIAAILLAILVGVWAGEAAGASVGLMAGLCLLGFSFFAYESRQAHLDPLFAALMTLGTACYFRTWNNGSRWWCTFGSLLLFFATFVKGPHALIVLVLALLWALFTRRASAFFNLGTLVGILVFAALAGIWLLLAYQEREAKGPGLGRAYIDQAFFQNFLGRLEGARAHEKPWWAYLAVLPLNLLPLTPILLLLMIPSIWRGLWAGAKPLLRFSLFWMVSEVLLASLLAGKREIYLLPVYPAAAMLVALAADAASVAKSKLLLIWCGVASFVLVATGTVLVLAGGLLDGGFTTVLSYAKDLIGESLTPKLERLGIDGEGTPEFRRGLLFVGALMLPFSVATLALTLARARRAAVGWLAATSAVTVGAVCAFVLPTLDDSNSRRGVAEVIQAKMTPTVASSPLGIFRHLDEGLPFYLKRPIREVAGKDPASGARPQADIPAEREMAREKVREFLETPGAILVLREDDSKDFGFEPDKDFIELGRKRAGSKMFLIVGPVP